ncbi:glucosaminidase domain-containing protein [Paenibacillus chondroitinus]|uniref:Glucosaminidase domain-containing protein n=1 Tax=Paenibacillus chondroitinus TaxID=59842 RepID=A0ABU6D677_9BACL|nr:MULTISPECIES: glucosaminidase domain-containing protein [Paenibacillus]MCY9658104.1 glucosaminidase domain-containing protein [Paenibacillus anseongense]MEB4793234.1 glucosaminidase domain-containing protein [Paenibacillus chondroitinus]
MKNQEFINKIAPAAVEDMINTSVLASITIAQAALESAWGQSAPGNNLFGIKGSGTTQTTKEFINGEWVTIKAGFRSYQNWLGSIADHSKFLLENPRYRNAGFFDQCCARDYAGAANALQAAGYATDPQYAVKLIGIIESNRLQQFDQEADNVMREIEDLKGQIQTLLNTAEAHIEKINVLETKASMAVPAWAQNAVSAAVCSGLIDTPEGRSYDFYSMLTLFHRKGLI